VTHQQHPRKSRKVLLLTRNLPPLVGGMERLNWHMADELSQYAQVRVVGPKGATATKPEQTKLSEAPLNPLLGFMSIAFFKALWVALRWSPHFIIAGSGLTAPLVWLISKFSGAQSAVYLHGFDITAPSLVYQKLWKPLFRKMDCIIVNSTPTKQLALSAGVPKNKIYLVFPGVNLPEAPQSAEMISAFKRKHGLEGKKILLSVGRLTTRKGLREFVEHALPEIVKLEPDTVLVVVGEAPKNSLGAGIQTEDSIRKQAQKSGVSGHVLFLGVITDKSQLATVYEASDVHVFPVRHIPNDPEGFGMVAIEAAAHGLPTAAFATGGIVDAVCHGKSGLLAEQDDYTQLRRHTMQLLQNPLSEGDIKGFAKGFTWHNFGTRITSALTSSSDVEW